MAEKIIDPTDSESSISEYENKVKTLEEYIESDRARPINFIGKKYYTEEYIDRANKELSEKLSTEHNTRDESDKLAELEFTYALSHDEVLPNCRASLASEYDDHINGIDIVCKLKNKNGGAPHVFGIDVCTATLPSAVGKKFAQGDHPRRDIPAGCSFVKFYEDGDYIACIKGAPRFVLGASPLFVGHQKYFDNFHLENDGSVSHTPDPDLQFNILSCLFIQSSNLRRKLEEKGTGDESIRKRAIETCKAIRIASSNALCRLMDVKQGDNFYDKFNEELTKARGLKVNGYTDVCYSSVVSESIRRQNLDHNSKSPSGNIPIGTSRNQT